MPSMSEDAVFKALLKNKPQQNAQAEKKTEVPVKTAPKAPTSAASSEDAMYKALLKNKPAQQSTPLVKKSLPVKTEPVPAPQEVSAYKEPVVEAAVSPAVSPVKADQIEESIKNLTASVNTVQGLLKTAIIVLVLILIVGLASLIKGV
jgi:Tfp pilus assembly protein FimV